MSTRFGRTFNSNVMEYDGWGFNIPATLYIEMVQSSQFKQLAHSVKAWFTGETSQTKSKQPKLQDNVKIVEKVTLDELTDENSIEGAMDDLESDFNTDSK